MLKAVASGGGSGISGNVGAAQRSLGLRNSSLTIQGLGHSFFGQSNYQPAEQIFPAVPAWQPNTSYVVGNCVTNGTLNGIPLLFRCITLGTSASSGGPIKTQAGTPIIDNTVHWFYLGYGSAQKSGATSLTWAEMFNPKLFWDMSLGTGGLATGTAKVYVTNPGTGYLLNDTVVFSVGGAGHIGAVNANGGILSIVVDSPGQQSTITITTATGSGATFESTQSGTGTFGTSGCLLSNCAARIQEVITANPDIIVFDCGTNDTNSLIPFATMISDTVGAQFILDTLCAAGIYVIIDPITPRSSQTAPRVALKQRFNNWLLDYYNKKPYANPSGYAVGFADSRGMWCDGTAALDVPVGGTSGTITNVADTSGLHPFNNGGCAKGYNIAIAAQARTGPIAQDIPRNYSTSDGYDLVTNPGGNMLEAQAWAALTVYTLGQTVNNSGNIYVNAQAGTSASSGGPTGTGSAITDGTAKWNYANRPSGMSVFLGTGGTITSPGSGMVISGTLPAGWTIQRTSGSASGTIVCSIESPWSDGHTGQRPVFEISVGSGTATEQYRLRGITIPYANLGILASDLGVASIYSELEIEFSGLQLMNQFYTQLNDTSVSGSFLASLTGAWMSGGAAADTCIPASSGSPIPLPGKMLLRTQPMLLPLDLVNIAVPEFIFGFNAAGAAGSATGVIKINYTGIFKLGVS